MLEKRRSAEFVVIGVKECRIQPISVRDPLLDSVIFNRLEAGRMVILACKPIGNFQGELLAAL